MKRMFLVMIFILISFSFGCGGYKSDMSGIKNLVQNEIFEQEGKYIIFFYREGCDGCEQTKPYVLTYKNMLKEDKYKDCKMIYGVNLSNPKNSSIYRTYKNDDGQGTNKAFFVNGVEKWDDLYIGSTPSIIIITNKNGKNVARYEAQGKEKIIDSLNEQLN